MEYGGETVVHNTKLGDIAANVKSMTVARASASGVARDW
ncbi:hypothetical protein OHAE_3336 [Ochrobactrum soli]|uniref:Uncharacterized protein n=1 Tax=Ochrobactrum soli TaxID=2448455 RepID=A0A2P9HH24_9HYPH|nr:hypothetical protein OHAE_3336 [[Ochrobactrum] soli]